MYLSHVVIDRGESGQLLKAYDLPSSTSDEYLVHLALAKSLARFMPDVFAITKRTMPRLKVEFYSDRSHRQLGKIARKLAHPLTEHVARWDEASGRKLKDPLDKQKIPFEVSLPMEAGRHKRDPYQNIGQTCDGDVGKPFVNEQSARLLWLNRELDKEGVKLLSATQVDRQNVIFCRRNNSGGRRLRTFNVVVSSFAGLLELREGNIEDFQHLLLGGMGNHTTFGWGMIRLHGGAL